jgi:uncharacterized protein (DUF427 family)
MTHSPQDLQQARDQWQWRGHARPAFAVVPEPGQESVWDYPRPPALVPEAREVVVRWGEIEVARSLRCLRLLETAHPPTFYLPWADVDRRWLRPAGGGSFCEWKGPARYWSLVKPLLGESLDARREANARRDANARDELELPRIAWSYPEPLAGAESIADHVAFYATGLACTVGGAPAQPQRGGFYGGWITPELVGPFKGDPGTAGW